VAPSPAPRHPRADLRLLWLSYVGFVSLGLPDTVLGAAWPAVRAELGLPLDAAGAALLVTTLGVVLSSALSARLRRHLGTGYVLLGSTLLAAGALLGMGLSSRLAEVLAAAFVAGLGGGAIDASLNDYVAREHSARHLSWLHACWGVGASSAPLVVALVLARGGSWRLAYFALATAEVLLALSFLRTLALWRSAAGQPLPSEPAPPTELGTTGAARASIALFYAYGGLEVSAGLWASSLLTETRHATPAEASAGVGLFWAALTAGRVVAGLVADRLGALHVLRAAVHCALLAALLLAVPSTPPWLFTAALASLGFALAPVYPLAMHDTPRRFGDSGSRIVGYQVAAASLGMATLPWLLGVVAAHTSLTLLPGLLALLALTLIGLERARRATVRSGGSR
jgi:fucose permease